MKKKEVPHEKRNTETEFTTAFAINIKNFRANTKQKKVANTKSHIQKSKKKIAGYYHYISLAHLCWTDEQQKRQDIAVAA